MKNLFLFITLVVSFSSISQNEIVYIRSSKKSQLQNEISLILNENNSESLINVLKREIRRSEIIKRDDKTISIKFNDIFRGNEANEIYVAGLQNSVLDNLSTDTTEFKIKGFKCRNLSTPYESDNQSLYCESYYSLDYIEGVVYLEGISQEKFSTLKNTLNKGEELEAYEKFYGEDRIGFVRTLEFKDDLDSNNIISKKCISFSIPISYLDKISEDNWAKVIYKLRKKAIKQAINDEDYKDVLIMNYKNIKGISEMFYFDRIGLDLHFGLNIFNY